MSKPNQTRDDPQASFALDDPTPDTAATDKARKGAKAGAGTPTQAAPKSNAKPDRKGASKGADAPAKVRRRIKAKPDAGSRAEPKMHAAPPEPSAQPEGKAKPRTQPGSKSAAAPAGKSGGKAESAPQPRVEPESPAAAPPANGSGGHGPEPDTETADGAAPAAAVETQQAQPEAGSRVLRYVYDDDGCWKQLEDGTRVDLSEDAWRLELARHFKRGETPRETPPDSPDA